MIIKLYIRNIFKDKVKQFQIVLYCKKLDFNKQICNKN